MSNTSEEKEKFAKNNKATKPSIQASKNTNKNTNEDSSLFEDLPIPGDFGHGKFCICKDCREKIGCYRFNEINNFMKSGIKKKNIRDVEIGDHVKQTVSQEVRNAEKS